MSLGQQLEPAVALEAVSKRYAIGDRHGLVSRGGPRETLWALRDIDLCVAPGESVGLIGHNGAGKTTLLRLLAGITRPTRGRVQTSGRVASLINLGAGFHPELTGRENIFLNGVILGLTRREVASRFDAIVDFADLGEYIDTPLKRYSSGMFARLGFAVAAFVEPDVLLVDEVLSVGDVAFQDRSIRKMLSFRDSGRAILFVSHNLSAVEMMCQRTVWLERGRVRMAGPTADVVQAYLESVDQALIQATLGPDVQATAADNAPYPSADRGGTLLIRDLSLNDSAGTIASDFGFGDELRVHVRCLATQIVHGVRCVLTVRGDYGPLFSATSDVFETWTPGGHELDCVFAELPLLPGLYRLEAELTYTGASRWSLPRAAGAFRIVTELAEYGSDSVVGATKSRGGFLAVAYDWRLWSSAGEQILPGLRLPRNISASRPP
ncbi:MAG: ATP-binding cassette domain-containing protein [Chloroflexi bacterium]|nr:ATP-binding cassette domain-containing protein [Chloroflexota bacterium]MBV9601826.1 ATP-binding cassette domain-containing protein [Chloroflexota bacterium]